MSVTYLLLRPGSEPPAIDALRPFKAVLVLDQAVPDEWQHRISDWLVGSGCLYMMAWGTGCSSWDDSVDYASILAAGCHDVPDDEFVMTTWHDNQSLPETFWFASHNARHPAVTLSNVLIIDVGTADRATLLLSTYAAAKNAPAQDRDKWFAEVDGCAIMSGMEYLLHEVADAVAAHLSKGFRIERLDLGGARTSCPNGSVHAALDHSQRLWGARSEYALLAIPIDQPAPTDAAAILLIPYNDGGLISVCRVRGSVPAERAKPADWFAVAAKPFQDLCRPWFEVR